MQTLPKDVVEKILNEGSSKDFINFCIAYPQACKNEDIWARRFRRDFGKYLPNENNIKNSQARNIYLKYMKPLENKDEDIKEKYLYFFKSAAETTDELVKRVVE